MSTEPAQNARHSHCSECGACLRIAPKGGSVRCPECGAEWFSCPE